MFTVAYCLVVALGLGLPLGLGLGLGLDFVSGWLVVMHTNLYIVFLLVSTVIVTLPGVTW